MTTPSEPRPLPGMAIVAALAITLLAVAGVSVFYWQRGHHAERQSTSISESQPTPAEVPSGMDKDGQFLWRLGAQGLQLQRSNDAAINDARRVCTRFAAGESEQQIARDIVRGSPDMSIETATDFADTAISVYCPQGVLNAP